MEVSNSLQKTRTARAKLKENVVKRDDKIFKNTTGYFVL